MTERRPRLTAAELDAECGSQLPDKEVVSLLDLFVDIDVALDLAAPIDLAVAANANVAAPIEAAVSANVLSFGGDAQSATQQVTQITQGITGDSTAVAPQDATIDQTNDVIDDGTSGDAITAEDQVVGGTGEAVDGTLDGAAGTVGDAVDGTSGTVTDTVGDTTDAAAGATTEVTEGNLLDGDLLAVDVNVDLDADMAAPIAGAVAAQANVAAPIDAAAAANVGSVDSEAIAISNQSSIITQTIEGNATATAEQTADVAQ